MTRDRDLDDVWIDQVDEKGERIDSHGPFATQREASSWAFELYGPDGWEVRRAPWGTHDHNHENQP